MAKSKLSGRKKISGGSRATAQSTSAAKAKRAPTKADLLAKVAALEGGSCFIAWRITDTEAIE
jgi:hypothetical protein